MEKSLDDLPVPKIQKSLAVRMDKKDDNKRRKI